MIVRNRLISLLYRCGCFVVTVFALIFLFAKASTGEIISYFGVQANILAACAFGLLVILNAIDLRHGAKGVPAGLYMPVSLAILLYLLFSGIVYFSALVPFQIGLSSLSLTFILSEIAVPLLYLGDWVFFQEKGTVKWTAPFYWLIFPIFYGVFILFFRPYIFPHALFSLFAQNGARYPYFFLNPVTLGWGYLWLSVLLALTALFGLGELLIFFNDLMAGRFKKRD